MGEIPAFEGGSVRRKEDERLITGRGRYLDDIRVPGMTFGWFVRSPMAHGHIVGLDLEVARSTPGVVAVFDAATLDAPDMSSQAPPLVGGGMDRPILVRDRVRYTGEAVALVVAEDRTTSVDAASSVWVDVDPLPPVTTAATALAASPIHPTAPSNIVEDFSMGDRDAEWDHDVVTTTETRNQRINPTPIEPMAALAIPEGEGIRLVVAHQAPHLLKRQIGAMLEFPIEVEVPDVGGGFGQKARFFPEYVALVVAAQKLGRPIHWLQTRRENLLTGSHGRDMVYTVKLGGSTDGRIERAHIDILANVGAYPHIGGQIASFARLLSQELYDIPTLSITSRTLVTNTAPVAPYRGAGRPQAAFGMERAVDAFARAAGLEPIDVRRKNVVTTFPYRSNTGALYDSGDYLTTLDRAAALIDIDSVRAEQNRRMGTDASPIGVGFGGYVERAGGAIDTAEFGSVALEPDGTLVVRTGSTSNGQGHETVWAQLVAQALAVNLADVSVVAGDTSRVPRGTGSTASRSAQIGGAAVWVCAQRLATRCRRIAAEILDTPLDVLTTSGPGALGAPDGRSVDLVAIYRHAAATGQILVEEEWYSPGAQTFPYGVHAAVAEVELETGQVNLIRYVAVDDSGTILNPMIVDGQTIGSVAQGVGQAMLEAVEYDEQGQMLNGTLVDYRIPQAADVPPITTGRVVSPAPSNPLGAKGAAEGGTIGAPPAIVNAVLDALAPHGVDDLDMPLRPEKVWAALQKTAGQAGSIPTTQ